MRSVILYAWKSSAFAGVPEGKLRPSWTGGRPEIGACRITSVYRDAGLVMTQRGTPRILNSLRRSDMDARLPGLAGTLFSPIG